MTTDEMKTTITAIIDNEYGVRIYALLNNIGSLSIMRFIPDDYLLRCIGGMLERILRDTFLEEGTKLEAVENIDNNQNIFYEISQNDEYRPFAFLDTFNTVTESYSEGNIDQLMGFLFRFNVNDNAFWLYQQIAYSQMIKRSKNLYAILSRDKVYTLLNKDVLKIESKIDCVIIGESIITKKIDLMQRSFHFEEYIRKEAEKTIQLIEEMDIVENLYRLIALGERKALTNAKKLMKAKQSPVLRMRKDVLMSKLNNLPRYKDKWKIHDGKILIQNQNEALEFLKMLNDDILRSELTDTEYDSAVKTELPPLG